METLTLPKVQDIEIAEYLTHDNTDYRFRVLFDDITISGKVSIDFEVDTEAEEDLGIHESYYVLSKHFHELEVRSEEENRVVTISKDEMQSRLHEVENKIDDLEIE